MTEQWFILIWVVIFVIAGIWLMRYIYKSTYIEEQELQINEDGLKQIAEHRTYLVNQWICLLAFWFDIDVKKAQTKLTTPGINQNTVYFFFENLEIYAIFDWDRNAMEVKTSVFDEDEGYLTHNKVFSIANGSLDTAALFAFVQQAKEEHYGKYEITADEVIEIVKQIKTMSKAFPSEDAAENHLFNNMADLMIIMRQKKLRNNPKLMKVYMGLVYYLWAQYGKEFLKFLEVEELEPTEKEESTE